MRNPFAGWTFQTPFTDGWKFSNTPLGQAALWVKERLSTSRPTASHQIFIPVVTLVMMAPAAVSAQTTNTTNTDTDINNGTNQVLASFASFFGSAAISFLTVHLVATRFHLLPANKEYVEEFTGKLNDALAQRNGYRTSRQEHKAEIAAFRQHLAALDEKNNIDPLRPQLSAFSKQLQAFDRALVINEHILLSLQRDEIDIEALQAAKEALTSAQTNLQQVIQTPISIATTKAEIGKQIEFTKKQRNSLIPLLAQAKIALQELLAQRDIMVSADNPAKYKNSNVYSLLYLPKFASHAARNFGVSAFINLLLLLSIEIPLTPSLFAVTVTLSVVLGLSTTTTTVVKIVQANGKEDDGVGLLVAQAFVTLGQIADAKPDADEDNEEEEVQVAVLQ